jgi:hypothetical protein
MTGGCSPVLVRGDEMRVVVLVHQATKRVEHNTPRCTPVSHTVGLSSQSDGQTHALFLLSTRSSWSLGFHEKSSLRPIAAPARQQTRILTRPAT